MRVVIDEGYKVRLTEEPEPILSDEEKFYKNITDFIDRLNESQNRRLDALNQLMIRGQLESNN
jgi:hypothetical protein